MTPCLAPDEANPPADDAVIGCGRTAMDVDAEDFCWICLDDAPGKHDLMRPCSCPRKVHPKCLARWQLQQAGRPEETRCRFCNSTLADWKASLTPETLKPEVEKVQPIMVVYFEGEIHRIPVKQGSDGLQEFTHRIRELFRLPEDVDISLTFGCKEPMSGQHLKLEGIGAFDAAVHCASVAAAERQMKIRSGGGAPAIGPSGPNSRAGSGGGDTEGADDTAPATPTATDTPTPAFPWAPVPSPTQAPSQVVLPQLQQHLPNPFIHGPPDPVLPPPHLSPGSPFFLNQFHAPGLPYSQALQQQQQQQQHYHQLQQHHHQHLSHQQQHQLQLQQLQQQQYQQQQHQQWQEQYQHQQQVGQYGTHDIFGSQAMPSALADPIYSPVIAHSSHFIVPSLPPRLGPSPQPSVFQPTLSGATSVSSSPISMLSSARSLSSYSEDAMLPGRSLLPTPAAGTVAEQVDDRSSSGNTVSVNANSARRARRSQQQQQQAPSSSEEQQEALALHHAQQLVDSCGAAEQLAQLGPQGSISGRIRSGFKAFSKKLAQLVQSQPPHGLAGCQEAGGSGSSLGRESHHAQY